VRNGTHCLEIGKVSMVSSFVMLVVSMSVFVLFGIVLSQMGMYGIFMVYSFMEEECKFISDGYLIGLLPLSMGLIFNSLHLTYYIYGVNITFIWLKECFVEYLPLGDRIFSAFLSILI